MSRSERLTAFVAAGARTPFVWGTCDCTLWVADWVLSETGIDLGTGRRGSYASALGCRRLLQSAGGLSVLVADLMARAGFAEADAPAVGDVGLIETTAGPMMAISTGERWALKTADGVAVVGATPIEIWRI
ncbi:MAG: hypothetical protein J0J10_26205 [Bosea sp.]|uniref:DUF6950 family protein n=1 Tax=Bosea sp. (in: a-proteobacteria) TaxID=1871050 RepID=UPI001AC5758A|nr:hypothetical protein [Bosea sp. (in: a-proteobacteria)]MBN9472259.1 hypothetical protein [Bosea sp. (in: a-proteobacteria)]